MHSADIYLTLCSVWRIRFFIFNFFLVRSFFGVVFYVLFRVLLLLSRHSVSSHSFITIDFFFGRFIYFFYLWLVSRRYQWMTWWIYIQAMVYGFYIHFYCWNYNTFELEWLRTFLFSSKIISVCIERSQFHWNLNTILCSRLNWKKCINVN